MIVVRVKSKETMKVSFDLDLHASIYWHKTGDDTNLTDEDRRLIVKTAVLGLDFNALAEHASQLSLDRFEFVLEPEMVVGESK